MQIQIIMYSTKYCGPCKIVKPKFIELVKAHPDYPSFIIDPQEEVVEDVHAVPCFKVIKDSKVVFQAYGMEGFNELEKFIETIIN